ncbi:MAG: hypothetical protein Q9180_004639 [Flavoplaca navasiana]
MAVKLISILSSFNQNNNAFQESQGKVDIVLFPEEEEGEDGAIQALSDKTLPFSIISRGMLNQLGVNYTPCNVERVKDAKGDQYSPVGKVDLRWHRKGAGKSHPEPFRVVDQNNSIVILGGPAFPKSVKPPGGSVQPIGTHKQTAVLIMTYFKEQKLAQERKKLETAQRREQEKREQEEKEAERRRQDKQKK